MKITKETIKNLKKEQYDLKEEIIKNTNINIVTCGGCGATILHKMGRDKIKCPYCDSKEDICFFPDLIY